MGAAIVRIAEENWLYLTDWGPNRLLLPGDGELLATEAAERGVALGARDEIWLIGWSPLVDDFSGNGLDDILVTQGVLPSVREETVLEQVHTLLAQKPTGLFAAVDEGLGFVAPQPESENMAALLADAARGAVRLDLDGSGHLHVVVAVVDGPLQVYRLEHAEGTPHPRRCTLSPTNSVVPSRAWGYAISDASGEDFRTRDIQGQMRASPPGTLLTEHTEGILRFPSGWEEPFSCTPGEGPVPIVEPDWIRVDRTGSQVRLEVDRPEHLGEPANVEVLTRNAEGDVVRRTGEPGAVPGTWTVDAADAAHAMLVLDGRHVARWWPVPEAD